LVLIKTKLHRLWEGIYKKDNILESIENPYSPKKQRSYLESILDKIAPSNRSRITRPIYRKNKLFLYLAEPATNYIGLIKY
jgi:hypothetical protein